ncbi:MAG: glycosyltransferase family 4 protein [Dehalococcoidales bacterium]|nr:glycosyltransferase family 4 protein [Dehalococcoidales bacterium]
MNLLFISEIDWNKKVVYDTQLLAEAMAKTGHTVYAIDHQINDNKTGTHEMVSRAIEGAEIHLIHPPFIRMTGLNRLSAFVTHYFAIDNAIKQYKIDAIVLYSVPTNGLQSLYLAGKYGIPIVFRSLDILHKMVHYPLLGTITKKLESFVYSRVDKFLVITPKLSDYAVRLGASYEKTEYLPITLDTQLFRPMSQNNIRGQWGISDDDYVILFIGTLFDFSGLDIVIDSLDYIRNKVDKVKLLLVGDGPQRTVLEKHIAEKNLEENVIITGWQPYKNVPDYINCADVCINPFASNEITKDIFPGKIVQYLACAKPVVLTPLDGVTELIAGNGEGVIYSETENMHIHITDLLTDDEKRQQLGNEGYDYAQRHDCLNVASQLEKILDELMVK